MAAPTNTSIGKGTNTSNNNTITLTTTAAVAAGETIVVRVLNNDKRTTSTLTDSAGNTYVERADNQGGSVWHCLNPSALSSGGTITATLSGNSQGKVILADKLDVTATYEDANSDNNGGSSADTVSVTINSIPADAIVFAAAVNRSDRTGTNPVGWTEDYNAKVDSSRFLGAYDDTTSSGNVTYTADFSGNGDVVAVIIALTGSVTSHSLTADDTEAQAPSIGTPSITQKHVLTGSDAESQSPTLGTPAVTQVHALSASDTEAQAPTPGTPTAAITHPLGANDTEAQAPDIGSPSVGQLHVLTGADTEAQNPVLGAPTLTVVGQEQPSTGGAPRGARPYGDIPSHLLEEQTVPAKVKKAKPKKRPERLKELVEELEEAVEQKQAPTPIPTIDYARALRDQQFYLETARYLLVLQAQVQALDAGIADAIAARTERLRRERDDVAVLLLAAA